jgi:hypothetical protein
VLIVAKTAVSWRSRSKAALATTADWKPCRSVSRRRPLTSAWLGGIV